ncbi:glycosyltransferase family 4 protein [Porphyromonas levii]|uniref:glycosyltransferase family 4 protein n=1 Tax=Porphyromonas levii TaxID=28114 RepID=UPI00036E23FD|nr:glycosyltransferase family 4 protein [Porphyromonas levii]
MGTENKNNKLLRVVTSAGTFGLIKGQLRYLREHGYEVIGISGAPIERSKKASETEGIRTIVVPDLVRPISISNDLKALLEFIRVIRKERPDIVHANTPKGSLLGMMAAWWCRVPHRIYTVTGLRFETATGTFRWLLKTMERITCACATKVIPEGEGVKKTLIREQITNKSLQKIHNGNINGIDLEYFNRTPEIQGTAQELRAQIGGDFIFVFIGRIVRDKGMIELVDAFERLNQEHPSCRLLLVGSTEPELDPLPDATSAKLDSNPNIYQAGWQTDVRPWLVASDAFAFGSYREGFPNVVLQAGAMGLPSVVTDINGCNEIIIEGKNGYIVPKQDSEALYQGMKKLYEDRDKTKEMSEVAREMIATRYKQEDVWQATLEMYQSLLKEDASADV